MAGPYTAFTYGDPTISPAVLNCQPQLMGYSPTGNLYPVPVAAALAGGIVGTAYSETIGAQGGASPYTFSVLTGSIPTGTSLTGATGIIAGTPTTPGTYTFTIEVTDSNGITGTQGFQIIIASAPAAGVSNYGYVN